MRRENNIYNVVFKVNHAGGSGSCFFLKQYNLFITNYHVVESFQTVSIEDNEQNRYLANVILVNPKVDIALLSVDHDFSYLPKLDFSKEDKIKIGQQIYVAGYPFGMPFTLTEGTISSPKQLMDNSYYIQTDAAVNPGNSGCPMFNSKNELIAITVSKFTDADNMGFGIPLSSLQIPLESIKKLDKKSFQVQCTSCDELISEEEEYCPSCGNKLPENVFKERNLTDFAAFCEEAIADMGINPVLARMGYEYWKFHKGSSQIRMFVYRKSYLFCTSPINLLPKKNLEPILSYLISNDLTPYQLGLDDNQIFISYRIHISDIFSEHAEEIKKNITQLAFKADELDNFLVDNYDCELSEYAKK
ncbi:MAG: trypsin-like peptidase domain-containing protein [Bacteroidales bacterium]|jgi:predicted RNA-binding Zn-ribbon protein involved in translation (DUF1610 family)|nr:trypsin-like peptidase domain-containing protein [Bacteroidales bacterium]